MKKHFAAWLLIAAAPLTGLRSAEALLPSSALAFPSIQRGASARAIGLGSAYVGLAEGSAALLWNPAGLGSLPAAELALHHSSSYLGAIQDIAVIGLPLGARNGLGLSFNYQDQGAMEGRDAVGAPTGDYSARLYGASLGWGVRLPAGFSLGATAKANRQSIAGSDLDAIAGDLGLLWTAGPAFTLGAAYSNFGPAVRGNPLAQGLRVGASSYLGKCEDLQWLFAVSGEALTHGENSLHAGIEGTLYQVLALRAGYSLDVPGSPDPGVLGWTAGAGLLLGRLSLDYAYEPHRDLGSMQRVSLTYAFGDRCQAPADEKAAEAPAVEAFPPPPAVAEAAPPIPTPTPEPTPEPEAAFPLPAPVSVGTYTVQKGDSLWTISDKDQVLGDSFRWPLLYKANRDQIQDPDLIEPALALKFRTNYTDAEAQAAVQKAGDTPRYEPHVVPRLPLPMKY